MRLSPGAAEKPYTVEEAVSYNELDYISVRGAHKMDKLGQTHSQPLMLLSHCKMSDTHPIPTLATNQSIVGGSTFSIAPVARMVDKTSKGGTVYLSRRWGHRSMYMGAIAAWHS